MEAFSGMKNKETPRQRREARLQGEFITLVSYHMC